MSEWWSGLTPAEATVRCDGATHVLRWAAGKLTAPDHGDPAAEATLAALAGTTYPCLEHLAAWRRRRDDPRVLAIASRGAIDRLVIDPDDPRRAHMPHPRREEDLVSLLALGGGLPDRLQATVAATWARRLQSGHRALEQTRPRLHAALYGRVLAALRSWLAEPQLTIELEMVEADAPRAVERSASGESVAVALPFAWLCEVWACELAVALGRFCLAATPTDGGGWTLDMLAPDLATRQTVDVSVHHRT